MSMEHRIEIARKLLEVAGGTRLPIGQSLNHLFTPLEHVRLKDGYTLETYTVDSASRWTHKYYVHKDSAVIEYKPEVKEVVHPEGYIDLFGDVAAAKEYVFEPYDDDYLIREPLPHQASDAMPNVLKYFEYEPSLDSAWEILMLFILLSYNQGPNSRGYPLFDMASLEEAAAKHHLDPSNIIEREIVPLIIPLKDNDVRITYSEWTNSSGVMFHEVFGQYIDGAYRFIYRQNMNILKYHGVHFF